MGPSGGGIESMSVGELCMLSAWLQVHVGLSRMHLANMTIATSHFMTFVIFVRAWPSGSSSGGHGPFSASTACIGPANLPGLLAHG